MTQANTKVAETPISAATADKLRPHATLADLSDPVTKAIMSAPSSTLSGAGKAPPDSRRADGSLISHDGCPLP